MTLKFETRPSGYFADRNFSLFYQAVKYKLVKLFEAFKSKPVLHTELSNFFVI